MSNELVVPSVPERTRNQIIGYLGTKTPRQIAELTGVTPETVIMVKRELVESMDALTAEEHVAKSFVELNRITQLAMSEFSSTDDARSKAPLLAAATSAVKTSLQMLEKWSAKNKGAVDVLNKKRQREIVEAFTIMSETTGTLLDDGEPHSKDEIVQVMIDSLREAVVGMEARNEVS